MKNKNYILLLLLFIYILVFQLPYIFLNQYFWDDHTVINSSMLGLSQQFDESGRFYLKYFYIFFKGPNQIRILRLVIFLLYNMTVYFIYKSIKYYINNKTINYTLLIFILIFPYFSAKINVINLFYIFGFFLFIISYYLVIINKDNWSYVFITNLLFLCSYFLLNSLIFLVPVLLFLHNFLYKKKSLKSTIDNVKYFLIIDFLFILFRIFILKPYNRYIDYNPITYLTIIKSPIYFIQSVLYHFYSFFNLILISIQLYKLLTFISVIIFILVIKFIKNNINKFQILLKLNHKMIFIVSFIIFLFSCISYNIAGQIIGFSFLISRNQNILIISYFLFFLIFLIIVYKTNKTFFIYSTSFIFTLLLNLSIINLLEIFKGSFVQDSIIYNFKTNKKLFNLNHNFEVLNNVDSYIWKNSYRNYVLSGMYNSNISSKQDKIFVDKTEHVYLNKNVEFYKLEQYKMKSIFPEDKYLNIELNSNPKIKNELYIYSTFFNYFFNKKKYNSNIIDLISIKY